LPPLALSKHQFIDMLKLEKPWLAQLPTLSQTKIEVLEANFPFDQKDHEGGLLARLSSSEREAC
jgi:hypothetical protein